MSLSRAALPPGRTKFWTIAFLRRLRKAKDNQIAAFENEITSLKEKLEVSEIESPSTRGTTFKSKDAKSKDAKGDPYQQLGEDLINALKRTTKGGHDQP